MGGKSYFCDYCCCYMKNDINVRKKHNTGVSHTIAKYTYMRRYEDPRRILAEEQAKIPCTRYLKGYCKFDLYCLFSHFNAKQLQELQNIVTTLETRKTKEKPEIEEPAAGAWLTQLPWQQPLNAAKRRGRTKLLKSLPVSLRPIKFHKLNETHFDLPWG